MLKNIGIKVSEFYLINSLKELTDVFYKFGQKAILKTCRDGYDGKGNLVLKISVSSKKLIKYLLGWR